jgi:hypothetical protein
MIPVLSPRYSGERVRVRGGIREIATTPLPPLTPALSPE